MQFLGSESKYLFGPFSSEREEIAFKYRNTPLSYLKLSSRSLKALLRSNIKMTVGDIILADTCATLVEHLGPARLKEVDRKVSLFFEMAASTLDDSHTLHKSRILSGEGGSYQYRSYGPNPQSVSEISIRSLPLKEGTCKVLCKQNITTVGALDALNNLDRAFLLYLSVDELEDINTALVTLHSSLEEDGSIDWLRFWEAAGITIIPSKKVLEEINHETIIKIFPKIIEEILLQRYSEKAYVVLKYRSGIENGVKCTLEEIGNMLGGISRERVRQIEEQTIAMLKKTFLEEINADSNYRIHPFVYQIVRSVHRSIIDSPFHLLFIEDIYRQVIKEYDRMEEELRVAIALILFVLGARPIEFDYLNAQPLWGYEENEQLAMWLRSLDHLLTCETVHPLSESQILASINRGAGPQAMLQPQRLQALLDLCNTVERTKYGLVQGKTEFLKGRGNQIERLLLMENRPMRVRDIIDRLNQLFKQNPVANVAGTLVRDSRFLPIGRTGQWRLAVWKHLDMQNIPDLIEECFIVLNRPATLDELYVYVSGRRPTSKSSVTSFLLMHKSRFIKVDRNMWGLMQWANDTEMGNTLLTREMARSIGDEKLRNLQRLEAKTTKRWVRERVRVILENTPGQRLFSYEIIERLQNERDISKGLLSKCIMQLDYIQVRPLPRTRLKICILKTLPV